jgi:5-(carboxyamino)imidazole ribonucleotide synthase
VNIGVVGGGQLARMLALAGHPLGLHFTFLDPAPDACAAPLGTHLKGSYDDVGMLQRLASASDVVTYEFENVPEAAIAYLSGRATLYPGSDAHAIARDRWREKHLFRELGLPTAEFRAVDSLEGLRQAVSEIGLPAVLKTRTMGYDGKGQAVLRKSDDMAAAWQQLGGVPLILEGFVRFDREVSIIAVRAREGELRFYPLAENEHRDGILHLTRCRPEDGMQAQAERYARAVLEALDYVGVLTLELFQAGDMLLVNEMAPRIHNSGHWTIEGTAVSQFEQHLRAILGLPLGDTRALGHAAMVNFIGAMPPMAQVLAVPGVKLHDYGKQPKSGRKLGHATVVAADTRGMDAALLRLLALARISSS